MGNIKLVIGEALNKKLCMIPSKKEIEKDIFLLKVIKLQVLMVSPCASFIIYGA